MESLSLVLERAGREHWAVGHFNISELDHMRAIVDACKNVGAPVMIGLSEGERTHIGLMAAVRLRDIFRYEHQIPVFLNADHSQHVENAKAAIDAGFDSIHIDLSLTEFSENIAGTREIVEYARVKNPDISVEGELGYLRGESKVMQEKIEVSHEDYTKREQASAFVKETGVDRLAIVVGNIHGLSLGEPDLDIERIRQIRAATPSHVALVLHAGSGIPDAQIRAAIQAGIANIHINTDLRVAYVNALRKSLEEQPDEVAMYKLDTSAMEAMKDVVKEKLILFGSVGKI
ncbi:MAG: fructose-bisphosphate aldolase, class II [Parcubacteria group bacterium Gr01-1014_66]|nr:MAG: fructose-bisphosphate aldolase, class II [Parcubacteria group bacterium Gr01-1014_66]